MGEEPLPPRAQRTQRKAETGEWKWYAECDQGFMPIGGRKRMGPVHAWRLFSKIIFKDQIAGKNWALAGAMEKQS
jgi:hypothetical protein